MHRRSPLATPTTMAIHPRIEMPPIRCTRVPRTTCPILRNRHPTTTLVTNGPVSQLTQTMRQRNKPARLTQPPPSMGTKEVVPTVAKHPPR